MHSLKRIITLVGVRRLVCAIVVGATSSEDFLAVRILCVLRCRVLFSLGRCEFVNISAIDWRRVLVAAVTYCVSSETLNPARWPIQRIHARS